MSTNQTNQIPADPVIARDYRKQGNLFAVSQYGRIQGYFTREIHANLFIRALFDRQCIMHSVAMLEPFKVETVYLGPQ